jgi:enoyl-CoA hydratase
MTTIDFGADAYTSIDDLLLALSDGVLSVTMNRPDSLNSLTAAMLTTIGDTLERAAADPRVKVCDSAVRGAAFPPARG